MSYVKLLLLLTVVLLQACQSTAQDKEVGNRNGAHSGKSVQVIGEGIGSTLELAKLDAIRSALAQAIPQYIVVERALINDSVERDIIASTMNGYISKIEVLDTTVDENGFTNITVDVLISENKIQDYLKTFKASYVDNSATVVDGDSLYDQIQLERARIEAENNRKAQQLKTAQSLTKKIFSGYPSNATAITMQDVKFETGMPEEVQLSYHYDFKSEWTQEFWRQASVIDKLMEDSESENFIKVCARDPYTCAKLPKTDRITLFLSKFSQKNYTTSSTHFLLVPIFSSNKQYLGCRKILLEDGATDERSSYVTFNQTPIGPYPHQKIYFNNEDIIMRDGRYFDLDGNGVFVRLEVDYRLRAENSSFLLAEDYMFLMTEQAGMSKFVDTLLGNDNNTIDLGALVVSLFSEDEELTSGVSLFETIKTNTLFNNKFNAKYFFPFMVIKRSNMYHKDITQAGERSYQRLCRKEGLIKLTNLGG